MDLFEIISGTFLLITIGTVCGSLLLIRSRRWPENSSDVVYQINKLLPQTQCAQCGYPGRKPYAEANAGGEAINKCPPGGAATVRNGADHRKERGGPP